MLFALLTVFAGLAIGVALLVGGHLFLGVVVCLSAFPVALSVWLATNYRTER
jgi:hypothetical protein